MAAPHRVVIIGGGFGGLSVVNELRKSPVDVTVIDRCNYHLFQPLLYQVATGSLSPANIASPLRNVLQKPEEHAACCWAKRYIIDAANRRVILSDGAVDYDTLDRRHRREPPVFRPRRMGAVRARPENHGRRHGDARPDSSGV